MTTDTRKELFLTSLIFLFFTCFIYAQTTIAGKILSVDGLTIQDASVVLLDSENNSIIKYTYSNADGTFKFELESKNEQTVYLLRVNLLGYEQVTETITIDKVNNNYNLSLRLKQKLEKLNEILLKPGEKISNEGNTTTIKVTPFLNQSEQTVEDVLKKLPGIEVTKDGNIKAHGKFIKKLMIDGDDMFADGYKMLTKNLDAKTIDAVQILDEFQDNPVLAKVLDSDDVALNLKLKDKFKNIWFGNSSLGLGTEERNNVAANIGLLKKKIKFFYLANYNNLGNKASDQVNSTPGSFNFSSVYKEITIEPKITPVYAINKNENQILKSDQSIFNKALMNSLGVVTKLKPNLELRLTSSFSRDDQEQPFFSRSIFNVEEDPIEYTESSKTFHKNNIGTGELEIKYTGGNRSYLRNVLSYNNQPENLNNKLIFNGEDEISQSLNKKEYSIYNHLNYSYAVSKKSVLHNYLYVGKNNISQDVLINSPILNDIFSLQEDSDIQQNTKDLLKVVGINSNLFSDYGDLTSRIEFGYESVEEVREFNIEPIQETDSYQIDSLKNSFDYRSNKFTILTKLNYKLSDRVKLRGGIALDYVTLYANFHEVEEWIFKPQLELDLSKLKIGRFIFGYEKGYSIPDSYLFLPNFMLNNYNSFVRGTNNLDIIKREEYRFYYKWANDLESQAFSLRIKYEDFEGEYSSINEIGENIKFSMYQFVKGSEKLSASANFTSFFDDLNFSTNFSSSQNWTRQPILANSEGFKMLNGYSATYLFSATTYFKMPFNFKVKANLNYSKSNFNNVTSKVDWTNLALNVNYNISKEWHAEIINDYYKMTNNSYYFIKSMISYQPELSSFSYSLMLNNLTNEQSFENEFIDQFTTYQSQIQLLPRYFFVSVKYRF
ncbi:TonB-dependent receptor [Formosa sp. A9]|uniref:TonB-dependent receptor n=1 Tax=Formosa sp. A9 TaxID=3442641 RepID=UPI003EB8103F